MRHGFIDVALHTRIPCRGGQKASFPEPMTRSLVSALLLLLYSETAASQFFTQASDQVTSNRSIEHGFEHKPKQAQRK